MDADKKRIWIRGQFVEVTDEVYRAYMQGDRKMRYFENDLKTDESDIIGLSQKAFKHLDASMMI